MYPVDKKLLKKLLPYVPLIGKELAKHLLEKMLIPQRLPIVHITRGYDKVKDFTLVVDDQM